MYDVGPGGGRNNKNLDPFRSINIVIRKGLGKRMRKTGIEKEETVPCKPPIKK